MNGIIFANSIFQQMVAKKITTHILQNTKAGGEKISMLTAYDFSFAKLFDKAGIDVILVGDSASNVMAGHETTLPITLDQMIYHASSVIRGVSRSLVIGGPPLRILSIQFKRGPDLGHPDHERNRRASG